MPAKKSAKKFDARKGVIAYLQSQLTAVVSTVSPDGRPQASTVFYWINDFHGDDFSFFFVTRRHTRKFENLMSNKKVAFVVGTEFAPSTVQVEGEAELLDVGDQLKDMLELQKRLRTKPALARLLGGEFFPRNPISKLGKNHALFKVRPTWIRWMRHDRAKSDITYHDILGNGAN